jgi:hypothetical protein
MSNDLVKRAMSFVFESDQKALRESLIAILQLHVQPDAGGPIHDVVYVGVKYHDCTWTHPDKPQQTRLSPPLKMVNCLPEHETQAANLLSDQQALERDTKRAQKTLTMLVRGMNTDQDLRDSLSDSIAEKLGLAHLARERPPAWRYETMEPRVYQNLLKDLEMIDGYFNARFFLGA